MSESVKSATQLIPSTVRRKIHMRCFLTSTLLVTLALPFLPTSAWLLELMEVWHELLFLMAVLLNSVVVIQRCRTRKAQDLKSDVGAPTKSSTGFSWNEIMLWNFAGMVLIVLLVQVAIRPAVAWGLVICLRIIIPAVWLFVMVAAPFACRQIHNRRICPVSKWVKPWFSLCLLLVLSESACLLILSLRHNVTPLTFPEQLPLPDDNNLHIASTGGSTSLGWPWHPHYSISRVAEWQLNRRLNSAQNPSNAGPPNFDADPGYRSVIVHNVAQAGNALKLDIAQLHRLPVKPHVLMVSTGHNEVYHEVDVQLRASGSAVPAVDRFLNWSPTFCLIDRLLTERISVLWRIVQRERRLVDDPYLTDDQRKQRLSVFTDRLRALSKYCRRHDIVLIWFIPAASEMACPPNRSTIRTQDRSARDLVAAAYQKARRLEQQQEWNQAAEVYQLTLRDNPGMAEFHFRLGHCLLRMDQPEAAAISFQNALETDAFPVRAQADHRHAVAQVAREYGNVTIDSAAILRRMTPHGILDDSVILDDVHPTLRGVFALGTKAADLIHNRVLNDSAAGDPETCGSFRESLVDLKVDPDVIAGAYERMADAMLNRACLRFEQSHWTSLSDRLRIAAFELRSRRSLPESTPIESLLELHPCQQ
ncbi:MAG: hypothetical protein O2856_04195 [Planctomycetota bacterium]|nr:hypothetical protein [Planctomycetota bacterium]